MPDDLDLIAALEKNVARCIVGKADVAAHREMILAIRDKIAPMVRQGMTLEQVTAAKPTAAAMTSCFNSRISGAASITTWAPAAASSSCAR